MAWPGPRATTASPALPQEWGKGQQAVEPTGFQHLERFHLEGSTPRPKRGTPVWTFACADALLEKRVWMQHGANTTTIRYDLRRATAPLALSIKALVNYRDHHGNTHAGDWQIQIEPVPHGLRVTPFKQVGGRSETCPYYLLSDRAEATPQHEWYRNYFLSLEAYRGLDALDDNLYAGLFMATLLLGESLTIVASTEAHLVGTGPAPAHLAPAQARAPARDAPTAIEHLALVADQFIVGRALPDDADGRTVIAGYPWFGDWGRDTMISLPGLTLVTGRHDVAERILRTFARFVDQGMLPNRFPDEGERPEYNTVDATLWYFEAVRATHAATDDDALLRDLFLVLQEIVEWHLRGTRYNIHVDPADGLLYAGEPGVQLTWMDAKVGDWVVTPRMGKPVEVNALWYNALRCMADFARRLGEPVERYDGLAQQARAGFARFWNETAGYCYDVIDGPRFGQGCKGARVQGCSSAPLPLGSPAPRLTSHGLRSLAPSDPAYVGRYGGDQRQRDAAYHQGTVWAWLIGPFVTAHLRVYGDRQRALAPLGAGRAFLQPLFRHLADHGVGSISDIFDGEPRPKRGEPPFRPRGCIAQAWSVAELLRAWHITRDAD